MILEELIMDKANIKKHFVGSISLTDQKASFDLTGVVEEFKDEKTNYCDPVFLINIKPYVGNKTISMKLNSVELRAALRALLGIATSSLNTYSRQSGGNHSQCHMNVSTRKEYHIIGLVRGDEKAEFSFKEYELFGFVKEAEMLCNTMSDALFKTQQMIARRKAKRAKLKQEDQTNA